MSDLNSGMLLGLLTPVSIGIFILFSALARLARTKAKLLKAETEHLRAVTAANFPSKPQDTDSK